MPVQETSVEELTRAYRLLDTPTSASAIAIKSNYRQLIKRWHPDKPATNAATYEEAVMMTKLINEAYALIEDAPLRYFEKEQAPAITSRMERPFRRAREKRGIGSLSDREAAVIEKRVEYVVRLVCGLLSGVCIGLIFAGDVVRNDIEILSTSVVCAILFAAGAVKLGDRVWREVFGIWWKWQ